MSTNSTLNEWRRLIAQPKSIFGWPDWATIVIRNRSDNFADNEPVSPLRSQQAQRAEILIQLQDENGIAIEGARIRIAVWMHRYLEDITATLEVLDAGDRWVCISRIDFVPPAPHFNKHYRRLGISPEIYGSHIHSCDDNAKIGVEAFSARENLPVAVGLEREPTSFRDIIEVVSDRLNVSGISELRAPEWNGELFDG